MKHGFRTVTAAVAAFACVLALPFPPARAQAPPPSDEPAWRPFGEAAFEEARRRNLPAFFLLTAPWNRDHFRTPGDLFRNEAVRYALRE